MSALRIEGSWTQATAPAALGQAHRYLEAETLDLSGVTQVDSSAVALLLELTRRAKAKGKVLQFTGLPPQLVTLTQFFGVDRMLDLKKTATTEEST